MTTKLSGSGPTGLAHPLGFRTRASDMAIWSTAAVAFEAYNAANIANYGIAAPEIGATGVYAFTNPAEAVPGSFRLIAAAGASLAVSDLANNMFWEGAAGPPSGLATDEQGRVASTPEAFGVGGRAVFPAANTNQLFSVAFQGSNNGMVACGWADNALGTIREAALARFKADGGLDTTFGGGFIYSSFGGFAVWNYVAIQDDDQFPVVMGYNFTTVPSNLHWNIWRYDTVGALDVMFAVPGLSGNGGQPFVGVFQPDGKLLSSGTSGNINVATDLTTVRHKTDGTLDTTWGGNGIVTTTFGTLTAGHGNAVQPDGKVVVGGTTTTGGVSDICIARYDTVGALDPTFGVGGKVTIDLGTNDDQLNVLRLYPDGRILFAGATKTGNTLYQAYVARCLSNGSLDPTFGTGGVVRLNFNSGGNELVYGHSLFILRSGIVAGAYVDDAATKWMVAARLNEDGSLDDDDETGYGYDGKSHVYFPQGPSVATSGALRSDEALALCGYVVDPVTGFDAALALIDQNGKSAALASSPVTLNMAQAVPMSNVGNTLGDCLNAARVQGFGNWIGDVVAKTVTLYAADNVTVVAVLSFDSLTNPTQRTAA